MPRTPRLPRLIRLTLASVALLSLVALGTLMHAALRGAADLGLPNQLTEPVAPETPSGEARLVFAEFGTNADAIYSAPATDPQDRTLVATVVHAAGWGLNPAPGIAGGRTSYTVLPPGATPSKESPAELWLLDVATGNQTRLARDADLLVSPVMRADGTMLAYRRTQAGGEQAIVKVDPQTHTRSVIHTDSSSFGIFPVGFDHSGAVLFSRLTASGTDLLRAGEDGEAEFIFHASDEIARDWRVSPGAEQVAYLAPELSGERWVHRVHVASLDGDRVDAAELPAAAGEHYAPAWHPGGALAVGARTAPLVLGGDGQLDLASSPVGFDVPLGWSIGGSYLSVRHFEGENSSASGHETLVVIGEDVRTTISAPGELIFLGWTGA